MLNAGKDLAAVLQALEVSESTYGRWRSQYGGMKAEEAKRLLKDAPGVELTDGPYAPGKHPQPAQAPGTDAVFVGRVRDDLAVKGAINLWVVADNLRKGAALNAVQIAERL